MEIKKLFNNPEPLTVTKGKDINATTYTYIVKGDNTGKTNAELALLCKQNASVVKIYRNTNTFAVIIFKKVELNRPLYQVNRYGNIRPTGWAVRNYFGI